jgi:hypothetical protein
MSYRSIASSDVDPQSPVTAELMQALDGNIAASLAGNSGAPRVADPTFSGSRTGNNTNTFNIAGEYGGLWTDFIAYAGSGGSTTAELSAAFSDDGTTWSSELALTGTLTTDEYLAGRVFIDYTLGAYQLLITNSSTTTDLGQSSGTVGSWPSGAITHVRLTTTIASAGKTSFLGRHQGGEAAL